MGWKVGKTGIKRDKQGLEREVHSLKSLGRRAHCFKTSGLCDVNLRNKVHIIDPITERQALNVCWGCYVRPVFIGRGRNVIPSLIGYILFDISPLIR